MRRLTTIDLSNADLAKFEAYEATVLPLAPKHGGRVEARVRALDGGSEVHLLFFPTSAAFEAYRNDPVRIAALPLWEASGAVSTVVEVDLVEA